MQQNPPSPKLRQIKSQSILPNLPHPHPMPPIPPLQLTTRLSQLRNLTQQKNKLIHELSALKEGALTALQEKQEIIDRLRNQNIGLGQGYFEDQKQQMQKELNKSIRRYREILEERNQIWGKYQQERVFFFQELYSKQAIIDQLSSRISALHVQLDAANEENRKIQSQLLQSETTIQKMQYQISQLKQQIRQYYKKTQSKPHHFNIEHYLCYKCLQSSPNSSPIPKKPQPYLQSQPQLNPSIQLLKSNHEQQIQQITIFYENQLKILKSFCEKDTIQANFGLRKTLETQICSENQENQSVNQIFTWKNSQTHSCNHSQRSQMMKLRLVHNLRNQLKLMKGNQTEGNEDRSEFTSNYFIYDNRYDGKGDDKNNLQGTKNINILQNLTVITEQSRRQQKPQPPHNLFRLSKKQLFWGLGGGLLGALTTFSILKVLQPSNLSHN